MLDAIRRVFYVFTVGLTLGLATIAMQAGSSLYVKSLLWIVFLMSLVLLITDDSI